MITYLIIACVALACVVVYLIFKLNTSLCLYGHLIEKHNKNMENDWTLEDKLKTSEDKLDNLKLVKDQVAASAKCIIDDLQSKLDKIKEEKMVGKFLETTVVFKSPEGRLEEESFEASSIKVDCEDGITDLMNNGEFVAEFYNRDIVYIKRELKPIVKDEG